LQRIGAGESYSRPEDIYRKAKARGMDYVTITDHNRIEGVMMLKEKHPADVFTGVETTAYFPEDRCKVHILIYGFEESEFEEIQNIRQNIYDLREYLIMRNLPHSVAHLTNSVNGKLAVEHVEQLLVMFNVFETINGHKSRLNNESAAQLVRAVTPETIEQLADKYNIEPTGLHPGKKGETGGSNDHGGLFIGRTYSEAEAVSMGDFLETIRYGRAGATGRSTDFKSHSFAVFKVAYDFSKHAGKKISSRVIEDLTENIFEAREFGFFDKIRLKSINATVQLAGNDVMSAKVVELLSQLSEKTESGHDEKFEMVYKTITSLSDEIIREVIKSITEKLEQLNIFSFLGQVSSYLPPLFMTAPFLTSINYLYKDRKLIGKLRKKYGLEKTNTRKRILWFTDTIKDLNGVSFTLQKLGWMAHERDHDIVLVTSLDEDEARDILPPNVMYLTSIFSFTAPYYDRYRLKVPSLLESINKIYEYDPDEIYISTPGFVGLVGLLCSGLMKIPSVGVFHSDFQLQLQAINDDDSLYSMVDTFTHWFYTSVDYIAVPTREYIKVLEDYGFDQKNITFLRKAVETDIFRPIENTHEIIRKKYDIGKGINLLFTGRVSQDKNMDVIIDTFLRACEKRNDLNLIIAGDGPYLDELTDKFGDKENIYFLGRIDRVHLPELYSAADIFLFPSEADTFGMSVLEAQACGVPAIVSDKGGPQDIVAAGKTGRVYPARDIESWVAAVLDYCEIIDKGEMAPLRLECRENATSRFTWEKVFEDIFDELQPAL
jgi:glycosyltransferase involved in cell wall biosynthesis